MTFDDFFDFDTARARVFLHREGDQKSMALLSDSDLLIIYKGKRHLFRINKLNQLRAEDKKLLFPFIVGGILAPFAFISFFVHPMQPWIHLISIIGGLVLLYIGWSGRPALVVIQKNKDEFIAYLPSISIHLRAFMDYTNELISYGDGQKYGLLIFFLLREDMIKSLFDINQADKVVFPMYGLTYQQLKLHKRTDGKIVAIDPLLCGREIKFEYDAVTKLFRPVIEGPLRIESRAEIPSSIK